MPTIEIHRVRIDPANVERLLEIRGAAVAEFQQQVPELLHAELVRIGVAPDQRRDARPDRIGTRPRSRRADPQLGERMGGALEELARRAAAGDSEALSTLVEEVQHPIYCACRGRCAPDDPSSPTAAT